MILFDHISTKKLSNTFRRTRKGTVKHKLTNWRKADRSTEFCLHLNNNRMYRMFLKLMRYITHQLQAELPAQFRAEMSLDLAYFFSLLLFFCSCFFIIAKNMQKGANFGLKQIICCQLINKYQKSYKKIYIYNVIMLYCVILRELKMY